MTRYDHVHEDRLPGHAALKRAEDRAAREKDAKVRTDTARLAAYLESLRRKAPGPSDAYVGRPGAPESPR